MESKTQIPNIFTAQKLAKSDDIILQACENFLLTLDDEILKTISPDGLDIKKIIDERRKLRHPLTKDIKISTYHISKPFIGETEKTTEDSVATEINKE